MPRARLPVSCVSLALLALASAPALACPTDSIARLLDRAEEARFWSDFWEDIDPREARAELARAGWLLGRAELLLLDDHCLDSPAGLGFAGQIAGGQVWMRRAAGRRRPGAPAIAAVTPP
jgi:hypothetical protein